MATERAMPVLLVGRTGLDQALRREPGVELLRAPSALDAIGELADLPDDPARPHPVVIVSADAQPLGEEAEQWVRGVRRLQPEAVVLRMALPGQRAEAWGSPFPFDGFVPFEAPAADVHAVIARARMQPATNGKSPTSAPAHHAEVACREPPEAAAALPAETGPVGDSELATRLVLGRPIESEAIECIRARTGASSVRFVRDSTTEGVPVAWRGCAMGRLVIDGVVLDEATLRGHADWLASWLRLEEQQVELRRAAFTDPLTGAWNRRYFDHFLPGVLERARAQRAMVTVLVFDIDDFKMYNDRFGHAAGDEILVETVRLLRSVIRPTDRVCRLGGDEFVVIFDEPQGPRQIGSRPPESVYAISRRFQKQICEHRFPKLGSLAPGTLTISGGLATFPWDGRTAAELLDRADQLAIESKRQGKNAITFGPDADRLCSAP
ncbi:MAG: GGDEF domain-containing protein [Phycisphaeraceae bacterium]|nr:GGDEF domain-containing protein [Phycisphaeraceae bacterium]